MVVKKPSACSAEELEAFKKLILAGGEVDVAGLDGRIKAAICLVSHYVENQELGGIAALKAPNDSYKNKVFSRAESPEKPSDFLFELGWVFVVEKYRGHGLSRQSSFWHDSI